MFGNYGKWHSAALISTDGQVIDSARKNTMAYTIRQTNDFAFG
jgi:hypothetical protein